MWATKMAVMSNCNNEYILDFYFFNFLNIYMVAISGTRLDKALKFYGELYNYPWKALIQLRSKRCPWTTCNPLKLVIPWTVEMERQLVKDLELMLLVLV